MAGTNKNVLMAGFGWIGAGIVSFAAWYVLVTGNSSAYSDPTNMLRISVLVTMVGIGILAFRKRIGRIADMKKAEIENRRAHRQKVSYK